MMYLASGTPSGLRITTKVTRSPFCTGSSSNRTVGQPCVAAQEPCENRSSQMTSRSWPRRVFSFRFSLLTCTGVRIGHGQRGESCSGTMARGESAHRSGAQVVFEEVFLVIFVELVFWLNDDAALGIPVFHRSIVH